MIIERKWFSLSHIRSENVSLRIGATEHSKAIVELTLLLLLLLQRDPFFLFTLAPLVFDVHVRYHGILDNWRERHQEAAHEEDVYTLHVRDLGQARVCAPYERHHCQHSCYTFSYH